MNPYKNFLIWGVFPSNGNESRCLKRKTSYYVILDNKLFKGRLTTPLLKCLNNQQAYYVMRELHEGICGLQTKGRSLATKVVCANYYWSTLRADTLDIIRRRKWCQELTDVPCTPPDNLHNLSSHWPFTMWGMDILGPLLKALGAVKYLLFAIDYFTMWIKERPLWEISANEVEKLT